MSKDSNRYKILIIEDNAGDFTLIEDFLYEQISFPQITHVGNFKQAKTLLTANNIKFDVILLDISLPDNSGEVLISEIIAMSSSQPVIVLTGYTDIRFSVKSLSLGIADYLLKDDITASALYKSIIYTIERRKTNIELLESQKRYSDLFQLSPQPMWLIETDTFKFVQANKAAVQQYGYTEKELLAMTIWDIISKKDGKAMKRSIIKYADKDMVYKGHTENVMKSGTVIKVDIYSSPLTIKGKLYLAVIAIDVTEKLLLQKQALEGKVQEQKRITKAVVEAQERERTEIGEELHDNVNQILAASTLYLSHSLAQEDKMPFILKGQQYIVTAMDEIRKLSHALVGPSRDSTFGLIVSIEELIGTIMHVSAIKVVLQHSDYHEDDKNPSLKLTIFRIIQEQLSNIIKHAGACEVVITLVKSDHYFRVVIKDNGVGFDFSALNKKGIGLRNIASRAELYNGTMKVTSSPGNGCEMTILFDLAVAKIPDGA